MPRTALGVAALLASLQLVSAHAGCDGYQHGHDLFRREPTQEVYVDRLRARYGQVPGRVLTDEAEIREYQKRNVKRQNSQIPASLTSIDLSAVNAISSGTSPEPTQPLPTTYGAGSVSPIQGAQALPAVTIIPSDWPALDRPPPTDTPQVQQWLSEIDLSGIASYGPTGIGGCQNTTVNAQAISEAGPTGRCWWTCGGCTRNTDITYCPTSNTWGLSYDDGPSPYTPKLMDFMAEADLKTTIFTVGSRAISYPDMLQYEYLAGHQIAVHTWSHFPLTTLTNEQIVAEIGWSKKAIYEITGVTPKYMRWPYGDGDDRVRYIMAQMGMTNVIWTAYNGRTFDTQDWQIAGGIVNTSTVVKNFDSILSQASQMGHGFIVLEHDLYQQSVDLAVEYVLPMALGNSNLKLQPIIECLGFNMSQAYIETATNASTGAVPTTPLVGASGTGLVPGLSYTPVALGGDATGPVTTLGVKASAGASSKSPASGNSAQAAAETSSALRSTLASTLAAGGIVAVVFTFLA